MALQNKEVNELIRKVETACVNALPNAEIMAKLSAYGYTVEVLTEVKDGPLENLKAAEALKIKEYNEKNIATSEADNLRKEFNKLYTDHVGLIRIALKNEPVLLKSLDVMGHRAKAIGTYLDQAKAFYNGLDNNPTAKAALLKLNTTEEELTGMKAKLAEIDAAREVQSKEKGEAQLATDKRDKIYDELNEWYQTFCGIAKIAFADSPQTLEILGIFVRNT